MMIGCESFVTEVKGWIRMCGQSRYDKFKTRLGTEHLQQKYVTRVKST